MEFYEIVIIIFVIVFSFQGLWAIVDAWRTRKDQIL